MMSCRPHVLRGGMVYTVVHTVTERLSRIQRTRILQPRAAPRWTRKHWTGVQPVQHYHNCSKAPAKRAGVYASPLSAFSTADSTARQLQLNHPWNCALPRCMIGPSVRGLAPPASAQPLCRSSTRETLAQQHSGPSPHGRPRTLGSHLSALSWRLAPGTRVGGPRRCRHSVRAQAAVSLRHETVLVFLASETSTRLVFGRTLADDSSGTMS